MIFLRLLKHVLPTGEAFKLTVSKPLRWFFEGLSLSFSDARDAVDTSYFDLFPAYTRRLDEWEAEFGLGNTKNLTEDDRRARLAAAWRAEGGQSPRSMQDALRNAGFDVYVHEWWEPSDRLPVNTPGCVAARDPRLYLLEENDFVERLSMGDVAASMGNPDCSFAAATSVVGFGYPLVNKVLADVTDFNFVMGDALASMGAVDITMGQTLSTETQFLRYPLPDDPDKWPYFFYISGQNFPEVVRIPTARREEFEDLILEKKPAHTWAGVIVDYV